MEVPPLANRQPTAEQAALVARLRGEIEEAHKVRQRSCEASCTWAEGFAASQLMQQLSTEKVRLAATAGDLVRAQPRWRREPVAQLTVLQVSGYIRTLDKDLAAFADELLAQAREAEAAAAAAQAQRYDLGPPAGVRGLGSRDSLHWL